MGYFIHTRDDRGQITTRCVWCREPRTEWLDARIFQWQRRHECDPTAVRTPTATVSGPYGDAGRGHAPRDTRPENGAQGAGEGT